MHERGGMSTLTRLALGAMGKLRPKSPTGDTSVNVVLPPPEKHGGLALLDSLALRASSRDFSPEPIPLTMLSTLLWAAWGVNRADGHRTAPTAINAQEIDLYVAMTSGAYLYDATAHALHLAAASDVRGVTGYQDFVTDAPIDLIYVGNQSRQVLVPVSQRHTYASVAAGAISQNVYLFCASAGLATVLRAWIDRDAIAEALGLSHDAEVLLSQTIGFPRA